VLGRSRGVGVEKALRQDWAVTLGPGIAAAQTRPGRALIGLCDWIETDFAAGTSVVCCNPVILASGRSLMASPSGKLPPCCPC